jgi:hypothetical protein
MAEGDNLAQAILSHRDYTNLCSSRRMPSEIVVFCRPGVYARREVRFRKELFHEPAKHQHEGAGFAGPYRKRRELPHKGLFSSSIPWLSVP